MRSRSQKRQLDEERHASEADGGRKRRCGHDECPIPTDEQCRERPSYEDYTVGVVCAIDFEMSAIRYMLDREHPPLPSVPGDSNSYVLGELSGHNVVIAWLPGSQGKGAAAAVATNMARTFLSIQWRLLVGIGGGVPSRKHDIRLGDVVISMPDGQYGGAVQYDLGKDTENAFVLKGFLLPPPATLRAAVGKMRSDHLVTQNKVNEFLSEMLQKGSGLSVYQRPSTELDVLFEVDSPHFPNQDTCEKCDRTKVVSRSPRESDAPQIHYGLVASGDRVMRSATKRNATGRDVGDILCFEMEAAGIMTEFPCLVIRGISDYADSHKNDVWHHNAAAAAAGCAKELLCYLDPVIPPSVPQYGFSDEYSNNNGLLRYSNAPVTPKRDGNTSLSEEQLSTLLDSLSFDQIDARRATIKNAHAKTCIWLLKKSEYLDWLDVTKLAEHHGFLWIKGKPGTGKSTIMKFALDKACRTMKDRIIISFFFNARGGDLEKSTIGMYRSLLYQLLKRVPEPQGIFDSLELATWNNSEYHQWSIESLKELFRQAVHSLDQSSRVLCFIDALDECDEHQIRDMISFFEDVGKVAISAGILLQICFSSRHYPHITISKGLGLVLEGQEGHNQDITNYVASELKIGHSKLAEQVRDELQDKACGVFIWVVLVVDILNKDYDDGDIEDLQEKLRNIPAGLHELFRDILTRDSHNKPKLLLCIQWILFAKQPLNPQQLYFAILSGIKPKVLKAWDEDNITMDVIGRFILSSSKGLAEITKSKTPTVQFIHESVRDFLLKENGLSELWPDLGNNFQGQSHERLKQCCLTYMGINISTHLDLSKPLPKAGEAATLRQSVAKAFPFLEYAVRNVLYHADVGEGGGVAQGEFIQSFQLEDWIKLDNLFEKHQVRRHKPKASLLYILAEQNMSNLIRVHPSNLSYLKQEKDRYGMPLFAALATGSVEAVRTFLRVEAENQSSSKLYDLYNQHCQSKGRLSNISGDFKSSRQRTLLSYVAEYGDEIVFEFILETGKDSLHSLHNHDRDGRTPLSYAAENNHEAVTKLLLKKGNIDVDRRDNKGRTPLSLAAGRGAK